MSLSKRLIVLAFVHLLVSQNVYASGLYGIGSRFRRDSDVDHLEPYQPNQKTPVPFGPHDSIQNYHPSVDPKSALHKRADEHFYDAFKCKGEQALNRIMHDPPSARVYTRQDQVAAWSPLQRRGAVSPELLPAVRALGIPTDPNVVKGVATFQSKQVITPDGQSHVSVNHVQSHRKVP